MLKLMLVALSAVALLSTQQQTLAQTQDARATQLIQELHARIRQHFLESKEGLVPLFRGSANTRVGDIWDASMTRLLDTSENCFGGLRTRTAQDTLSALTFQTGAAAGFVLGLQRLFDLGAQGDTRAVVNVEFLDVTEEIVAEGDFHRAYVASQCPVAQQIMTGNVIKIDQAPPVVIGKLYRGKRKIRIAYLDKGSLEARLQQVSSSVGKLPVSIEASIGGSAEQSIVLLDMVSVPLAFAPAFVPVRTGGAPLGGPGQISAEYTWKPFNPTDRVQYETLKELAVGVEHGWSWN